MFTRIGSILPETMKKNGIAERVRHATGLAAFEEAARAALPEPKRGDFKVLHLKGGTLTVACRSAAVASALKAREADLLSTVEGAERLRLMLSPWR